MRKKAALTSPIDLITDFKNALSTRPPWDSIVDFATHKSFCNQVLYPKQKTLLKLIYLETDHMTAFDLEVIERWRSGFSQLKEVSGVQPDIWQRVEWLKSRGYRHFPHIQSIIGRRGSKGVMGGILGAEKLAYMLWLDDWQRHFGVKPHSDGYLSVIATTLDQAKRYQFNDIKIVVEQCRYLQPHISSDKEYYLSITTPADKRYYNELLRRGVPIEREIASLKAYAFSANSASSRGGAGFANFYDEFAHQITGTGSQKTSEQIYSAGQPSLRQFKKDSLTYIPSTPFSQVGMFYTLYTQGIVPMVKFDEDGNIIKSIETEKSLGINAEEELNKATANPMMLICQFPSWELYEDFDQSTLVPNRPGSKICGPVIKSAVVEYNEEMKIIEKTNPDSFKVEFRAQFAPTQDAYLKPEKVEAMFLDLDWRAPLTPQERGVFAHSYRIHCDPGLSGANFSMAIGHLENAPCDECGWQEGEGHHSPGCNGHVWPHVIFDRLKVWRPMDYPDNVVDYVEVQEDLIQTLTDFPSTSMLSMDQWNSAYMLADLRKRFPEIRIHEETFTDTANVPRFEKFKSALNLGWVHSYRDNFFHDNSSCLLELEMKFLQMVNGKVKKQDTGPVQTKDLFDSVAVVTVELLHDALDRWYSMHLSKGAYGSTNVPDLRSGRVEERHQAMQATAGLGGVETRQDKFNRIMQQRGRDRLLGQGYDPRSVPISRGRRR